MIAKKDYLIGAVVGFFTGALALVILYFVEVRFPYDVPAAIFGVPILFAFGVWFGGFLGRRVKPFFTQFGKYAAAGFLSTTIDFATLNFVSALTGVTAGITIGWVNVPGFLISVFNGYLWNKLWVFGGPPSSTLGVKIPATPSVFPGGGLFSDFPKFVAVAVTGLLINSALIVVITTYIPVPFNLSPQRWLNVAKVFASIVVILWNFTGFKFFVFKKK